MNQAGTRRPLTAVYRLFKQIYPADSGKGAALFGGRWNSVGTELIYTAGSISLAVLEILANYSVLPLNYALAEITIPDDVVIEQIPDSQLPESWASVVPGVATQRFGDRWVKERRSSVLCVPSSVIARERNFVLNPAHPAFRKIVFSTPEPYIFDPRLR